MAKCFDLLGGIGSLVKNKTITIKLNLTGTDFRSYMERPVGETYMTQLLDRVALGRCSSPRAPAACVSWNQPQSKAPLGSTLALADWDVKTLEALGKVEFRKHPESGSGKSYSHLRVPGGGYMFRPGLKSLLSPTPT